jgi:hypothetical protein
MPSDLDLGSPAIVRMIDHPNREPSQPVLDVTQNSQIGVSTLMIVMMSGHRSRFSEEMRIQSTEHRAQSTEHRAVNGERKRLPQDLVVDLPAGHALDQGAMNSVFSRLCSAISRLCSFFSPPSHGATRRYLPVAHSLPAIQKGHA